MSTRGVDMFCPISQFSISTHIRDEPAKHYVEPTCVQIVVNLGSKVMKMSLTSRQVLTKCRAHVTETLVLRNFKIQIIKGSRDLFNNVLSSTPI